MAANYYDSTQAKYWTFSKSELASMRAELGKANQHLHARFPLPDARLLSIYVQQSLVKLGRRMTIRQQALATAQVYLKRFYLLVEVRKTNPYLLMATAVYLACKTEECPQHIRVMLGEAARHWPELGVSESSKIGECEFALISTLSSRLILHHPYRAVAELQAPLGLLPEEAQLALAIVNDSYNTDLPLLYPPHVIAITAIFLAVVLRPASSQTPGLQAPHATAGAQSSLSSPATSAPAVSAGVAQTALGGLAGLKGSGAKITKMVEWLAESKVDMDAVVDATQELVSLYEVWETAYNERACKEAITKFISAIK
nr:rna polymerase ii holoenzyme cyclin-like subunit [Quercus suber]